jgi:hypothetical protein
MALSQSSAVNQERNGEELLRRVTHDVQGAHETKDRLNLSLGQVPVLLEKIQWHDSCNLFVTKTLSQLGIIVCVESTVGLGIVLERELCTHEEALCRYISGKDVPDDKS